MKIKQLREHLKHNALAGDFGELSALLETIDDAPLSAFCDSIRVAVGKLAKSTDAEKKKELALNRPKIQSFLGELNDSKTESTTFEAVVKRIEKDKLMKTADATELASLYTGEARKYKSKREALQPILQRQISDKRGAVRKSQVSELF